MDTDIGRLVAHLVEHAVLTDGPYTLRSGETSDWYLDARQTTFSGEGSGLVGAALLSVLDDRVEAVGGLTMGADPIAIATALVGAQRGRALRAFSVRKAEKGHGTGGRLVGPVGAGDAVAVLEDTTTTGGAMLEAISVVRAEGLDIVQAISLVDRSGGRVAERVSALGIPYRTLITPPDLGVG